MKSINRLKTIPNEHLLQVQFALAAFGCMNADNIVHISTSITTGRRLYTYMQENGFKTLEEAKADTEAFAKNVIAPNMADSLALVKIWQEKTKGVVISPGQFEKCRDGGDVTWSQDAFMGMWLGFIDQKVSKEVMQPGWAYSDGAGEEYLHITCMQLGLRPRSTIEVVDTHNAALTLDKGILTMAEAFLDLQARGLKTPRLAKNLAALLLLEERYATGKIEPVPPVTLPAYDRASVLSARDDVMTILKTDYAEIVSSLERLNSADFTPMNILVDTKKPRAARNDNRKIIRPQAQHQTAKTPSAPR
jgi:hypothetical protein